MEKDAVGATIAYCGYSAPYLTLTAGDKVIECPSELPKQCKK